LFLFTPLYIAVTLGERQTVEGERKEKITEYPTELGRKKKKKEKKHNNIK
jgi:hypothetical protein